MMNKFLFFSLAKHQSKYFKRLLEAPVLSGVVCLPADMPWPKMFDMARVIRRLNWSQLIEDKCQERQVKAKYAGVFYQLLLRLELLFVALRAQALLDREQPEVLVLWNGSHRYCQILLALLPAGTRTAFFENGLLPNTTTFDPQGVNFRNSVPRDAEFYRRYAEHVEQSPEEAIALVPRKPRVEGLQPIELPKKYVFMPFQDDRDTQVRLFSPWIKNMRELFALGELIQAKTGLTVVFKEHPSSRESYPELHQRCHASLMFANGNSTQELIESSLFVVTLNSTVGLESLLLGRPLLTLGQAFFNIPGVVMHADSAEQMLDIVAAFPEWPLYPELRNSFLRYLREEYCVPGSWQQADNMHVHDVVVRLLNLIDKSE
jgi:capsular polysaccharide export protein